MSKKCCIFAAEMQYTHLIFIIYAEDTENPENRVGKF